MNSLKEYISNEINLLKKHQFKINSEIEIINEEMKHLQYVFETAYDYQLEWTSIAQSIERRWISWVNTTKNNIKQREKERTILFNNTRDMTINPDTDIDNLIKCRNTINTAEMNMYSFLNKHSQFPPLPYKEPKITDLPVNNYLIPIKL